MCIYISSDSKSNEIPHPFRAMQFCSDSISSIQYLFTLYPIIDHPMNIYYSSIQIRNVCWNFVESYLLRIRSSNFDDYEMGWKGQLKNFRNAEELHIFFWNMTFKSLRLRIILQLYLLKIEQILKLIKGIFK